MSCWRWPERASSGFPHSRGAVPCPVLLSIRSTSRGVRARRRRRRRRSALRRRLRGGRRR
ncbi:MAG: hypothetical protein DMD83_22070 [Candidatus Rokuibacteriota bacterium]|nr:MAG: hypothetical protein DMD83_22070 [Candidatus Rokubacteria bacterium]